MTVKELIEQLQTLDPDLRVFIKGYEGGVDDKTSISEPVDITLNVHTEWYYGEHEYTSTGYEPSNKQIVKGIVL